MTLGATAQWAHTGNISPGAVLLQKSIYSIWWLEMPYFTNRIIQLS